VQFASDVQAVPLFVPCTHCAGLTLPGGFVPQPLDVVVKENSEGNEPQQDTPLGHAA